MSITKKAPLWLLVLITISGTLAMHMFVPALPDAGAALGVGSATMQMTVSLYIIGLACGQLIYGPLSDGLGRRPLLLVGLGLYTVAGLVAALAPNADTLIVARLFQALGGCAGLALGRAMVRDTGAADDAVRDLALLNLMIMVGPGLAPLLGSLVTGVLGWRAVFVVLALLGGLTLVCAWRLLPETSQPSGQVSPRALAHDYKVLLSSPRFLGFAIGGGFATTSIYAFIAAGPFLFTHELHRPLHEVGLYLGGVVIGMSLGNLLTRRLIRKVSINRLLLCGSAISLSSVLVMLAIVLFGHLSLADVLLCMLLFTFGAGLASPASMTKALSVDTHLIGSAAGLYGFSQMAAGALCTFAVGFIANPALAAASVLAGGSLIGLAGFYLALRYEASMGRPQTVLEAPQPLPNTSR